MLNGKKKEYKLRLFSEDNFFIIQKLSVLMRLLKLCLIIRIHSYNKSITTLVI